MDGIIKLTMYYEVCEVISVYSGIQIDYGEKATKI